MRSANFVSQCLLAGSHVPLVKAPCRGYPCGKEEVRRRLHRCCSASIDINNNERNSIVFNVTEVHWADIFLVRLARKSWEHALLRTMAGSLLAELTLNPRVISRPGMCCCSTVSFWRLRPHSPARIVVIPVANGAFMIVIIQSNCRYLRIDWYP